MAYSEDMDESAAVFYVGQHETKRDLKTSEELVHHAQDIGVRCSEESSLPILINL